MEETAAPPAPAAVPRSIGERLRAGRERSGLSVAAAAEKLHLDPKVIEALEADRFAELGASVYVRGHLKRYGDFVGEAGAELVSSYTARDAKPPPPDLTQIPHAERRANPRELMTPLVGVACAVVLLAAIWWVLAGSRGDNASPAAVPAAVPDGTVAPAGTGGAVVPAGPAVPTPAPETPKPAPAEVASAPKRDPNAEAVTPPAREMRLTLAFANDSWVEIYDAAGKRLYYDVASPGSVQSVTGRGLRVILGNAAGVTVEVDGQARQIPESALDGEGARFVVNRSGSLARAR